MTAVAAQLTKVRSWVGQRRQGVKVVLAIIALAYPYIIKSYYLSLSIEVLVFAIFALSLDLLLGYTGLPSFGHAAYFGLGGYLVAYIASSSDLALGLTSNLLFTLPVIMSVTAVVALIIGFFALRTSGIYFLMITLAFAQMLFSIAIRWSGVTGGSDGLPGVARPTIGIGPLSYSFTSRESYYYLVLLFFLLSWWLMRKIVNSPFGWTLRGIRENEQRMRALGYNTFRYKMAAFAISGAMASVAGMLLVHFFRHASPDSLHWTTSGEVMVMLIIGGAGTLIGPIMGAALIRLFPLLVSSYTDRWKSLEGLLFIAFVLYAPQGILGLLRGKREQEGT
ncbi:MAG: branched-chain amino acid ABC transporter permease [Anaerolineae bacterium]